MAKRTQSMWPQAGASPPPPGTSSHLGAQAASLRSRPRAAPHSCSQATCREQCLSCSLFHSHHCPLPLLLPNAPPPPPRTLFCPTRELINVTNQIMQVLYFLTVLQQNGTFQTLVSYFHHKPAFRKDNEVKGQTLVTVSWCLLVMCWILK